MMMTGDFFYSVLMMMMKKIGCKNKMIKLFVNPQNNKRTNKKSVAILMVDFFFPSHSTLCS